MLYQFPIPAGVESIGKNFDVLAILIVIDNRSDSADEIIGVGQIAGLHDLQSMRQ